MRAGATIDTLAFVVWMEAYRTNNDPKIIANYFIARRMPGETARWQRHRKWARRKHACIFAQQPHRYFCRSPKFHLWTQHRKPADWIVVGDPEETKCTVLDQRGARSLSGHPPKRAPAHITSVCADLRWYVLRSVLVVDWTGYTLLFIVVFLCIFCVKAQPVVREGQCVIRWVHLSMCARLLRKL